MRALASFILRGPMQAMLVATVTALLSMLALPLTWPLAYLSGGAIALVTLKIGPKQGLQVAAGAVLGTALMAFAVWRVGEAPMVGIMFALVLWLPVWLTSVVLERTQSLSLAVQAAVGLGIAAVLIIFAIEGDPAAVWMELFTGIRPALEELGLPPGSEGTAVLEASAASATSYSVFMVLVLTLAVSLFLGRFWQAGTGPERSFRAEFRRLSFGRTMGYATLALLALAVLTDQALLQSLARVTLLGYGFVGLSVAHGALAGTGAATVGLVGIYALLLFFPQLVGLVGLADTWLDVRSRLRRSPRA